MKTIFLWLLLLQAGILCAQDTLQLPAHPEAAVINDGEYFFDTDPGFGSGNHFTMTSGATVSLVSTESIAGLSTGVHKLHIRMCDSMGKWSITNSRFLYVLHPSFSLPAHMAPETITKMEYFLDEDPGNGNGTSLELPASLTAEIANLPIDISSLEAGVHMINFRFCDSTGAWGHTTGSKIALVAIDIDLPPGQLADSIFTLEYFFDEDPGRGNGTLMTVPGTVALDSYTFTADIGSLEDGMHYLFIRALQNASLTTMHTFIIGEPLPLKMVSFNAKQEHKDALLSWKTANETAIRNFILESSSDGINFTAFDSVSTQNTYSNTYSSLDRDISRYHASRIYYRLRIQETDGSFGYTPVIPLDLNSTPSTIAYPNPFTDAFYVAIGPQFKNDTVIRISISDIAGRCIYEKQQYNSGNILITPGKLPSGTYLISVATGDHREVFPLIRK